ncbi:MAG: FHA domain-containing protein [Gemmatimonadota bacterium]
MMQLEFGGRRFEIPAGELAVGSDPSSGVVLAGEGIKPRHAVLRGSPDGGAVIQRGSADADTLLNGVRLPAEPAPILHGDKIQIGGQELLVVDSRKSGSTQFLDASAIAAMAAGLPSSAKKSGPAPVSGGRLVCLTDGREYTITESLVFGREAGSEVVVENTQVSRRHAEIKATPEGYVLTDLSTNGTFVNGQRIEGNRVLARADMIRVADNEFRFYADTPPVSAPAPIVVEPAPADMPSSSAPIEPPSVAAPALPEPSMPRPPGAALYASGQVEAPPGAAQRLNDTLHGGSFRPSTSNPAAAEGQRPASPMASLLVRTGKLKGTRLPIRVPIVNIGRAEYNDLVLADDSISTSHAKLQRREGVWTLVDLGSTNGTFVDGEQVTGEVPLGPGVTVRFGQVSVLFEPTDDAIGVAKGSGTRMMEPIQVPAPTPPAPRTPSPAARPPAPPVPREHAPRPAPRRPPVVVTPPRSSTSKWLMPVLIAVVLGAVILYLLKR